MPTCTLDCTSEGASRASRVLWLITKQTDRDSAGRAPRWTWPFTSKSQPSRGTKSACTFIVLTHISRRWRVVLFGFTTGEQQEQKAFCRAGQVQKLHLNRTCLVIRLSRSYIFLLLTKAVSAETSFLPDIVYAVWETSLKYIGKRLLLFCQYKPCFH